MLGPIGEKLPQVSATNHFLLSEKKKKKGFLAKQLGGIIFNIAQFSFKVLNFHLFSLFCQELNLKPTFFL
jgi:hypothetical protein